MSEVKVKKAKSFREAVALGDDDQLNAMLAKKEDELISRYGEGGEHEAANGWSQLIVKGETTYDIERDKVQVKVICPESGEQFGVYSSDLFQVRYAPALRKQKRKEASKARRREIAALIAEAKALRAASEG